MTSPSIPPDTILRVLRSATHWAQGISKTFADEVTACGDGLVPLRAEGGAVTLRGLANRTQPVSLCLASGADGPELHLMRVEEIVQTGFAAIRTTEVHLRLPRYLARQLVAPPPEAPEPMLVPA